LKRGGGETVQPRRMLFVKNCNEFFGSFEWRRLHLVERRMLSCRMCGEYTSSAYGIFSIIVCSTILNA